MAGEKQNQSGIEKAQAKLKGLTAEELLKKTLEDGHISASEGREIMERLRAEKLKINAETRNSLVELAGKEGWSGMVSKLKALDVPAARKEDGDSGKKTGETSTVEVSNAGGTTTPGTTDAPAKAPTKGPEKTVVAPTGPEAGKDRIKIYQEQLNSVDSMERFLVGKIEASLGSKDSDAEKSIQTILVKAENDGIFTRTEFESAVSGIGESTVENKIAAVRKLLAMAKDLLQKKLDAEKPRDVKGDKPVETAAPEKVDKAAEAKENEKLAELAKAIEESAGFDISKELNAHLDEISKDATVVARGNVDKVRASIPEAGKNKISNHVSNGKLERNGKAISYSFNLDPDGFDDFDHKKSYKVDVKADAKPEEAVAAAKKALIEAYKAQLAERPEIKNLTAKPQAAPAAAPATAPTPKATTGAGNGTYVA